MIIKNKYTVDNKSGHSRRPALALAISAALLCSQTGTAAEFTYNGDTGPGFWAELDGAWHACGDQAGQSPISIEATRPGTTLTALQPVLNLLDTPINVKNNGHTLENEYEPGSSITLDGVHYGLTQFHFHTLSEHSIGGERGAMEMHAVFKDEVSGDIVVLGQLFRLGAENGFLAQLDSNLPAKSGETFESDALINVGDGFEDLRKFLRYQGSLTTPPCSPIVTWIVLENWATMSAAQFERFNGVLGNNFRPQQPLAGRTVLKARGK